VRISDGKIAEHWGAMDGEALMRQLTPKTKKKQ
jgi:predicted ester cyclase